jgi:hydrogenase expression/formation protein HypC
MCLAIPARVTIIEEGQMATVDIMGVTRKVSLDLVPEAVEGDFVLVHAGFALQVVDEEYANETLELLRTLPFFDEEVRMDAIAEGA